MLFRSSLFLSEWRTKGKMSLVITEVFSSKGDMKCLTARSSLVDVIAPFQLGSLFPSLLKAKKTERKDQYNLPYTFILIHQIDCPCSVAQPSEWRYTERRATSSRFIDNLVS